MIVPSGNGSLPSRDAPIATSLPRMARRSLSLPSSWATEINLQSRYPEGILIPKIGELSSLAPPAENVIAPLTLTAMAAAITKIGICFMDPSFQVGHRSAFGDFDDCFGKSLRGFLGQIVPDAALDEPVRIFAREFLGIGTGIRVWCTIGIAFKGNGGPGNDRAFGKPLFQIVIFRLAFSQAEPPAIIMDYDADVIRVVKGRSRAIERGIIEVPLRRSDLPDELGKIVPVFLVAGPAAFRGEIILVPPLQLSLWRQRHLVGFTAADQITAYGDEGLAALRPERGDNVGRPRSPIITGEGRLLDLEGVHKSDDIDGNHRLLAVPGRF